MGRILWRVWGDDCGSSLLTAECLLVFALLVVGIISGLVATRQSLISELAEAANALMATDQSFDPKSQTNCESSTAGSSASDSTNRITFSSVVVSIAVVNQTPCD